MRWLAPWLLPLVACAGGDDLGETLGEGRVACLGSGSPCTCPAGYAPDGEACADIDECATDATACGAGVQCENRVGGFVCTCPRGYQLQDGACVDYNECSGANVCSIGSYCVNEVGSYHCACPPYEAFDGEFCVVDAELPTLRSETECLPDPRREWDPFSCRVTTSTTTLVVFRGQEDALYDVTLWVRGVVETKYYIGGVELAPFVDEGGRSDPADPWDEVILEIGNPARRLHLNAGTSGDQHSVELDYHLDVVIAGSSTVALTMYTGNGWTVNNADEDGNPIVIEGIPPAPDFFDGHFVHIVAERIVPRGR